ncbi:A predicted alpha-helical domain with a conserved ER motif [Ruminococcus sp. YE71]|uniref:alpha-E domain-containing protein n=1 Tax=unclassified Ruminococcus TaxID=2608920 RepID=UPI0008801606|nr:MULTISPECIES: alpha-E domain-containing protein [unclassified Ruminococcus]SDA28160.1 A predicted alpha-helical domain with a conserved ER motif [Ruminococcus sp. YE78]SFW35045.1 A predicted alpha-helical domain with a conserved ER motif [Ruminococcus sp. YE71]
MGTISLEHSDRLYWLGRYTERFFTTLKALGRQYDRMLGKQHGYTEYLECFGLTDIYTDNRDFIRSLLFDTNNAHSAAYSLERAYDNGIVLREEISTDSLSFLQMAKDTLSKAEQSGNVRLALLPLEDIVYSFWGSVNEHIYDDEIRNIIYIGKTVERLDLFMRMKYPFSTVEKEFVRLMKNLNRVPKGTPYRYNTKYLSDLVEILGTEEDYKRETEKAIDSLGHLFERQEVFA